MLKLLLILLVNVNLFAGVSNKEATAHRIYTSIEIDGKLIEEEWNHAIPLTGFKQKDPIEGLNASEITELFFLYDDKNLYIGARMHHKKPEEILAFVSRRDKIGNSEKIIVSFDTFLDNKTAYSFVVSATGVRSEYYHPTDNEYDRDFSYNPVWIADATIDSSGWSAEFEIPLSQLRFNQADDISFGINVNHWVPNLREDTYWVLVPRKDAGWASKFGTLKGLKGLKQSRNIEVLPYLSNNSFFDKNFDSDNPYTEKYESNFRTGLDLKYVLSSNITLDAAFNPDFGQVEADPAEVNLSAFETFFAEQRPFFLERQSLFTGIGSNYFYSRRIGAAPRNYYGEADYSDIPNSTQIIGAAKVTGRTDEGLNIGILSAVTNNSYAQEYFIEKDSTTEIQIEPLSFYNVARFQQEFGKATNSIGVIFTSTERIIDKESPLNDFFNKRAYTGAADYYFTFDNRTYELSGSLGGSYVEGSNNKMLALQLHPAHFYQRPDAAHIELDSNLSYLSGYTSVLNFNKIGGKHWLFNSQFRIESPGFELNDLGSLIRGDEMYSMMNLRYREITSTKYYHSYSFNLGTENQWNYEGNKLKSVIWTSFAFNFVNRASINLSTNYYFRALSDTETRGGPMMATPQEFEYNLSYNSDWTKAFTYSISINNNFNELNRERYQLSLNLVYNFGRLKINFYPNYRDEFQPLQYVTTKTNGKVETFGNRYIFGKLKRRELSTALRLDYALTPDFTLEFYAEPFVSDGKYLEYGELVKPRSFEINQYGDSEIAKKEDGNYTVYIDGKSFDLKNYDFHFISFRSNLVFRWEWSRGSTLFFVWQQNRAGYNAYSSGLNRKDFNDIFSLNGTNSIALKISYWLPVNI